MSATDLAARLGELERGLEGLLACFEAEQFPPLGALDACWARVLRGFEDVRAELASPEARAAQHEPLERCQRLYALATSLLARRRDELVSERSACGAARQHLSRMQDAAQGGDCDVRA